MTRKNKFIENRYLVIFIKKFERKCAIQKYFAIFCQKEIRKKNSVSKADEF